MMKRNVLLHDSVSFKSASHALLLLLWWWCAGGVHVAVATADADALLSSPHPSPLLAHINLKLQF